MKPYRLDLIICLILILATVAVFWQLPTHDFVSLDDNIYVYENRHVQKGLTREGFFWAFTTFRAGNWHPLTWLSHMLDCQFSGLNPGRHHLTNLLFHIANSLLLFLVLRRMTGARWRSVFVAALFGLHPFHVESVAWIAERKDVLSTFFWFLTMWSYTFYTERTTAHRYLMTLLFFALGLLAKPMLVTLPFVLLLMDYWPLHRVETFRSTNNHEARQFSALRLIWEKVPFFALAAASSIVTMIAQKSGGAMSTLPTIPIKVRIANAFVSYIKYMVKMIWPSDLAVLYPYPETSSAWQAAGAGLLLICISASLIRASRRRPYLGVGWLWFLGTLVPVIGLIQVGAQAMADRYTYVPLIGLFILVTWGGYDMARRWRYSRTVLNVAAVLSLLGVMFCTMSQVRYWKNSLTLFTHTLSITSNNWLVWNNLGVALAEKGRVEDAIRHYSEALRIWPDYAVVHLNLGKVLAEQEKFDEAIIHYRAALRIDPNFAKAHNHLGIVMTKQGKMEEAIDHYSKALRLKPDNAEVHNNLGILLDALGRMEEAIRHFSEALHIDSDYAKAHFNLAGALLHQKRVEEAVVHLYKAVRSNPDYEKAHLNLGIILMNQGKRKAAAFHFSEVARINPKNAKVYYFLELLSD
jgi:tetratricopeptide (TPR) repeat protein